MNRQERIQQCNEIEAWFEQVNDLLGTDFEPDKAGRRSVTEYISLLLSCDAFERSWLKKGAYEEAGRQYQQAAERLNRMIAGQNALCSMILPDNTTADPTSMARRMEREAEKKQEKYLDFLQQYRQCLNSGMTAEELERDEARKKALESLREECEIMKYTIEFLEEGQGLIKAPLEVNEKGLTCLKELIELLDADVAVLRNWITDKRFDLIYRFFLKEQRLANQIVTIEESLAPYWSDEVFRLDVVPYLERYRKDYTHLLKRRSRQYREDSAMFASMAIDPDEDLIDEDIVDLLEDLQTYHGCLAEIDKNAGEAQKQFGDAYRGLQTDWKELKGRLEIATRFNQFYQTYGMSEEMLAICCADPQERRQFQIREMTIAYMKEEGILSALLQVTSPYKGRSYVRCYKVIRQQWKDLETLMSMITDLKKGIITDMDFFARQKPVFVEEPTIALLQEYIKQYGAVVDCIHDYSEKEEDLRNSFPTMYHGISSAWDKMYYSWKHGKRICEYAQEHPLPMQTVSLLSLPLNERQELMIGEQSLMDLGFGSGRREYVDFFNEYPENVKLTRVRN